MNNNFALYSEYYDLLYRDKDYSAETAYILSLIKAHSHSTVGSLLELGCGTGIHALKLNAESDLYVCAVDISSAMLEGARKRASENCVSVDSVSFHQGDACSFRIDRKFDVVVSLFHVVSYQTTDRSLDALFKTAATHLSRDGLFIFDFWYGPAVLFQQPSVRVKRFSDHSMSITRLAEPVICHSENVVDVHYDLFVHDLASHSFSEVTEIHRMRYLFLPEIDFLLCSHGFARVRVEEWLTGNSLSLDSWSGCIVAVKL